MYQCINQYIYQDHQQPLDNSVCMGWGIIKCVKFQFGITGNPKINNKGLGLHFPPFAAKVM